jgi:hypothetical protein
MIMVTDMVTDIVKTEAENSSATKTAIENPAGNAQLKLCCTQLQTP